MPYRWFNWVHDQPDGREIVLERNSQEIGLWRMVWGVKFKLKRTVHYRGESYKLDREDGGVAETILRKMENGKEVMNVANTPYLIFVAPSGRRLCREIWDSEECWYFCQPGPITISF